MTASEVSHSGARPRRPGPTTRVRVVERVDGASRRHEDRLVTEEPLEVRVEQPGAPTRRFATTMRTPGHDFELATGLLLAEGVLRDLDHLRTVAYCTDVALTPEQELNVVTVGLTAPAGVDWQARQVSSACGVCGKESLEEVAAVLRGPMTGGPVLDADVVLDLPERLRARQRVFDLTGGVHAAGLLDADGEVLVVREDVGRHNAVDKVVGHGLMQDLLRRSAVLCTSGRIGFEIVQKAAVAQVPLIVAVGAPTSLAADLADRAGITLVGFTRGRRCVVYTHPRRVGP